MLYSTLFLLASVASAVSSSEIGSITCVYQYANFTICSRASELINVTHKGNSKFLQLELYNHTSIGPHTFASVQLVWLILIFSHPSTGEPRSVDLRPESFNGLEATLRTLDIYCWIVPHDSTPLSFLQNLESLTLQQSQLTEVPKNLLKDLRNLKQFVVKSHNIKTISDDSFSMLNPNIEVIFLEDGDLEFIQGKPFRNFTRLRMLSFTRNKLSDLQAGVFDGLVRMRTIKLGSNLLSKVKRDIFTPEHRVLTNVDLSDNQISEIEESAFPDIDVVMLSLAKNRLETLPVGAFSNLKLLRLLDLSRNRIRRISSYFNGLDNLRKLLIDSNEISRIEPFAFCGLTLEALRIRYNANLTELATDTFNGLTIGGFLELQFNNSSNIKDDAFRNLKAFDILLSGNPLRSIDRVRWGVGKDIIVNI
uniref:Uncharacterized protein n=1 Tax=Bracon brevicornis TaxID=1563983 RepID=A0A6V7JVM3_9HYME